MQVTYLPGNKHPQVLALGCAARRTFAGGSANDVLTRKVMARWRNADAQSSELCGRKIMPVRVRLWPPFKRRWCKGMLRNQGLRGAGLRPAERAI